MKYPNKCCRCGFCCLAECCPIALEYYSLWGLKKTDPCPALAFLGQEAHCRLADTGMIPFDDGCCIKARAYKDGEKYDFASLPDDMKILCAQNKLMQMIAAT